MVLLLLDAPCVELECLVDAIVTHLGLQLTQTLLELLHLDIYFAAGLASSASEVYTLREALFCQPSLRSFGLEEWQHGPFRRRAMLKRTHGRAQYRSFTSYDG